MTQYDLTNLLKWRSIGPFRGGRVVTVAGDPSDIATFYFGACAGGVWKTTDGGTYWENVSDGHFNTSAVGAIAVANSEPEVIYAGTGEATIRIDVSHGDGVYKSADGGRSWKHVGLKETRHISKIRVHPQNADLVYVAALGHAFGRNEERGVYRSKDGGDTWELILHKSDKAGAIDLTIDPTNPRILYASMWEAHRHNWIISSGGEDSGLYRSLDGGDTWENLSHKNGLPEGIYGKIGVSAANKRGRIWALIEAKEKPGLYRSDNHGDKWELVSEKAELLGRPWYFTHIHACPVDADTVYCNNYKFWKSIDAGKTFEEITTPHGDDHDLWIDPANPQRMIHGNDGGACVSYNGGYSWSSILNQPTAQFYHCDVDDQFPYRVYGTQQDNSSISVPNASDIGAIPWSDVHQRGTGESGYIAVDPKDNDVVYVGAIGSSPGGGNALQRHDLRTNQIRLITNWPMAYEGYGASEMKNRFNWTYPILFSPHDDNCLYMTGNKVFKTTDEGETWETLSPDLTLADPETLKPSGGPINLDCFGAETYATIFSFIESQHEKGVFWAGSDDGLIHISKDGGANWQNVTPADLPKFAIVSSIEQSPHDPATVYVAATRYKTDDYTPYIYKTTDYGKSWKRCANGLSDDLLVRVIREDPDREGLLYLGTETGLFLSMDGASSWSSFQLNLPMCPVHDLKFKGTDLVAATHGRAFWVLDDRTPLIQMTDAVVSAETHLFTPRTTTRFGASVFDSWVGGAPGKNYAVSFSEITTFTEAKDDNGWTERSFLDVGKNPPTGTIVTYRLKEDTALKVEILDAAGNVLRIYDSKPATPDDSLTEVEKAIAKAKKYAPAKAGMNRFVWDMRLEDGTKIEGTDPSASTPSGPLVAPGSYQARLTVGDSVQTATFDIVPDPRGDASQADLDAQFALLKQIQDKISESNKAVNGLRHAGKQIAAVVKSAKGHASEADIKAAAKTLKEELLTVEKPLIMPGMKGEVDVFNNGLRLLGKLDGVVPVVAIADFKPTQASYDVTEELIGEIDAVLEQIGVISAETLPQFNALLANHNLTGITI